ncbi:hypothetical protein [Candidatus Thiosymbion oneisti]|uniref:hypothetical protein n=1 Tax=Candidatus Thiosymbion oneisti TaxID=589554 RepID=UPI00105F89C8|nr:hypothetical protein [Candidatus Thiosymbion oneisti]
MLISEFLQEYWLHDSSITGWNWAASDRLVLELEVNINLADDTKDTDDFRQLILIFDGCTLIDELNEGFNGFSSGDAGILDATEVKESTSSTARQGIKLAMDYDNYDGKNEKFVLITIFADEFSVIDPKRQMSFP